VCSSDLAAHRTVESLSARGGGVGEGAGRASGMLLGVHAFAADGTGGSHGPRRIFVSLDKFALQAAGVVTR